jgi:hypothetical protein
MHSPPRLVRRIVSALLVAAVALGPVVTFAAAAPEHPDGGIAVDGGAPCEMPCDGCGDGKASPACAVACAGLVASILRAAIAALPQTRPTRAAAILKIRFTGREREPDKPPPKTSLPEPN